MSLHERRERCIEEQWMNKMASVERNYDTKLKDVEDKYQGEV